MSAITTMVRWYCEYLYNQERTSSVPSPGDWVTDPELIIPYAADKIFSFDFPIWDISYKPTLTQKILRHYYFREIGEETVGMWKMRLHQTLLEIMPYYNQLYQSTVIEYEPLWTRNWTEKYTNKGTSQENRKEQEEADYTDHQDTNVDMTDTQNQIYDATRDQVDNTTSTTDTTEHSETDTTGNTVTETTRNQTRNTVTKDAQSTTPMNRLIWNDIESGLYASETEWKKVDETIDETTHSNTDTTEHSETDRTANSKTVTDYTSKETDHAETTQNEMQNVKTTFDDKSNSNRDYNHDVVGATTLDYIRVITGWDGNSPNDEILKWRDTFINIDLMIINELEDCFLGIY